MHCVCYVFVNGFHDVKISVGGVSVFCVCYVFVNGFHAVKMFNLSVGGVSALCVLRVREWLP